MNWNSMADSQGRSCIFFYVGTAVLTIKVLLAYSTFFILPKGVDDALVVLGISCLMAKILFQQYNIRLFLYAAGMGVVVCICALRSRDYAALFSVLVICSFQGICIESFLKEIFYIQAGFSFAHIAVYGIRYWFDHGQLSFLLRDGEIRHAFGMTHANFFAMLICWIVLEWIYLNFETLSLRHLIASELLNFVIYSLTLSRTSFFIGTLVVAMTGISRYVKSIRTIIIQSSQYLYPVLALTSIWIAKWYFDAGGMIRNLLLKLNDVLTGRLNMWAVANQIYGFSFWGQPITGGGKVVWNDTYKITQLIVDNVYIYFAVKCGMALIVLFGVLYCMVGREKVLKKSIMIVALSVFSLMESFGTSIFLCFPLSFIGSRLYDKNLSSDWRMKYGKTKKESM